MPKKIQTFDILLFVIPILLLSISIAVIYSLVYGTLDSGLEIKQVISSLIGITIMFVISFFDYRFFKGTSWIFYIFSLLLLIYVDFFGFAAGGAMRWINLGPFGQLQPSEIAKVFVILVLSNFFCQKIGKMSWADIFISFLIMVLPLILILKEPDLGTALVVCFIYIVLLLCSKLSRVQLASVLSTILIFASVLIAASFDIKPFSSLMHDYQRKRIQTFLDPNLDPYGSGYNVRQAQIAVGSGGVFGKGLGKGSQSQLQFLPKPQTDFIFAGISESFGFVGIIVLLSLFAILLLKIISIGNIARDNFGMFLCFGTGALLFFQIIVNIGMNIGVAPVTGIPLPFSSYGGSALISYLFLIGLVQSVFVHHKKISFR